MIRRFWSRKKSSAAKPRSVFWAAKPLPVVEVRPKTGSYDYQNKYTAGRTEYFCPADFDAATTKRIQAAALGAFQAIGGRDYARVDVMVRADGSSRWCWK